MMYRITKCCPCCNEESTVILNEESKAAYDAYLNGVGYVQDIPINDHETEKEKKAVREFLKIGTCRECQKEIFG